MKKINKKRLHRVNEGKIFAGVCTGIADYWDMDVTIVRLGWILISLVAGSGLIAYILFALVMPGE